MPQNPSAERTTWKEHEEDPLSYIENDVCFATLVDIIYTILGGSWVVIHGVISLLIWVMTLVTLLRTLLIANHESKYSPSDHASSYSYSMIGVHYTRAVVVGQVCYYGCYSSY